ncbi:MAG: hypothetical protein LBG80_08760 [Bacteroidales bacterium]|jgi:hypothetical protein|nr:hypothetical protein [Bacteroidales bacterium]
MDTTVLSNDFSIVFDKVRQYNEENLLSDNDFLSHEEIIENEEIRKLGEICKEIHDASVETLIYQTFI